VFTCAAQAVLYLKIEEIGDIFVNPTGILLQDVLGGFCRLRVTIIGILDYRSSFSTLSSRGFAES
jgi:hypothetical protein